nr:MAG TPA: hypothetical protein [Caudoviricetes sp.]
MGSCVGVRDDLKCRKDLFRSSRTPTRNVRQVFFC